MGVEKEIGNDKGSLKTFISTQNELIRISGDFPLKFVTKAEKAIKCCFLSSKYIIRSLSKIMCLADIQKLGKLFPTTSLHAKKSFTCLISVCQDVIESALKKNIGLPLWETK